MSQSSLDSFIKNIDTKFSNVIDSTRQMVDSNKDATLSQLSSISSSYVGSQKESGDIMIHRKDRQKILVENKCYESRQVTSDQVKKFIHDVDIQNCSGLFLSQEGGIVNKDNFEINIHNRNVLLYIHNVNYDPEIIKIAIDIIDSFKTKLDEVTLTDDYPISKDTLEEINKEYQLFVEQKLNQLKMVKEFSQKMILLQENLFAKNVTLLEKIPSPFQFTKEHVTKQIHSSKKILSFLLLPYNYNNLSLFLFNNLFNKN